MRTWKQLTNREKRKVLGTISIQSILLLATLIVGLFVKESFLIYIGGFGFIVMLFFDLWYMKSKYDYVRSK